MRAWRRSRRVGGFWDEGAVGGAVHDPASVRCGGILIGIIGPGRMLKGEVLPGEARGEGAHGGVQARNEAAPRGTVPRVARIGVAESRYEAQKSPTGICKNAPDLPQGWSVSPLGLWGIFGSRKSAFNADFRVTEN